MRTPSSVAARKTRIAVDTGPYALCRNPLYLGTFLIIASEAAKFGDVWLNAKQGTDAALAMAFGHVILREFHLDRQAEYFEEYCRKYSDFPMLVKLEEKNGSFVPGRFLRADDLDDKLGEDNNPEWKTVAIDAASGGLVAPNGSIGYRWGEQGEWNLEEKAAGVETELKMSLILDSDRDDVLAVDFPYFGADASEAFSTGDQRPNVLMKNVPVIARSWKRPSQCVSSLKLPSPVPAPPWAACATGWCDLSGSAMSCSFGGTAWAGRKVQG